MTLATKTKEDQISDFVKQVFADTKAILTDIHVVCKSGEHGNAYVNKDAVYVYPDAISSLCTVIARAFERQGVEVVIAPATGGIVLSQWVASKLTGLSSGEDVLALYADKEKDEKGEDGFVIKRGYEELLVGKRVLILEDVLNTGDSAKKVVQKVKEAGGIVIGLGALCNRGGVTAETLGVPTLYSLLNITLSTWPEEECPLCKADVPINTKVGHSKDFFAKMAAMKNQ